MCLLELKKEQPHKSRKIIVLKNSFVKNVSHSVVLKQNNMFLKTFV